MLLLLAGWIPRPVDIILQGTVEVGPAAHHYSVLDSVLYLGVCMGVLPPTLTELQLLLPGNLGVLCWSPRVAMPSEKK